MNYNSNKKLTRKKQAATVILISPG